MIGISSQDIYYFYLKKFRRDCYYVQVNDSRQHSEGIPGPGTTTGSRPKLLSLEKIILIKELFVWVRVKDVRVHSERTTVDVNDGIT